MQVEQQRLDAAIARGTAALMARQQSDGAWDARSDIGPAATANVLVALSHVGALAAADLDGGVRWLAAQQRADGGFAPYPLADRSDLAATAQCWAALSLSPTSSGPAARAKAYVDSQGGTDAVLALMATGDVGAIYLGLAGLIAPEALPCPPLAWVLFPPAVRFLATKVHFGILMGSLQLGLIARGLRGRAVCGAEARAALDALTLFQNADGSWNGNTVQTALVIPAMVAAGLGVGDPRVRRAVQWIETRRVEEPDGVWYDVFSSDVWTTAFSLRAVLSTGISRSDPRVRSAIEWLLSTQLTVPQPWPDNRKHDAVRVGGWPFQSGNETMADCDDTGIVLSSFALALSPGDDGQELDLGMVARIQGSAARAERWLLDMQNPDGGWGAFVWSVPGVRPPGRLFSHPLDVPPSEPLKAFMTLLDPPPELGDPSTEGLTARVLHGLASFRLADHVKRDGVRFLRRFQTSEGGFWGRWLCNYLAASAYVLGAAHQMGVVAPWVDRTAAFLLAHQNPDGGWGESPQTYADPRLAGTGPSTPPLTGMVAAALVEAGYAEHPALSAAVRYLLEAQSPEGWPSGPYVAPNIPPAGFYTYLGAAEHLPLEALGRYRAAVHRG